MNLSIDPGFVWNVLNGAVAVSAAVYAWLSRRSNVTNETIEAIGRRIGAAESRLTVAEQELRHAPKSADLVDLRSDMGRMAEAVAALAGKVEAELSGINRQLSLIQEHLLSTSKP